MIANAVAALAALLAFPFLVVPLVKLGFVGLMLGGPLALLAYAVAFVVIDVGPIVGLVVAVMGRARALSWVTAGLSLGSLVLLVVAVQVARSHVDLDHDGRARGPRPAGCAPASKDASAVGRACEQSGGPAPTGDCPSGYWCFVEVQGRPDTTCRLPCRHDCECPGGLRCTFDRCVR